MTASISVNEKKDFIKWFLKNHHLKRRESVWILNYILGADEIIKNLHFVEEAHRCERSIVMTVQGNEGVGLRMYSGNLMTDDAERVFHDVRMNPRKTLYIQLNFDGRNQCPEYVSVLEDNPEIPVYVKQTEEDEKIATEFLEAMAKKFQRNEYMKQIDAALDRGDKRAFIELSEMIRTVSVSKQSMEV